MAQTEEELPPWHGRVSALLAVLAVLSVIALLVKSSYTCSTSQPFYLFFVCVKSWVYWIILVVGAAGWGTLTYLANQPKEVTPKEDDMLVVTPTITPTEVAPEPPKLELPSNRRAKNLDDRCAEIIDALETFTPKPRERHGEFPDQVYDFLKGKLPKKMWVIGAFKRKGNRGPHIIIDREIGVDLIDATENNLKALHRRVDNLGVEYKKIILVLWDHGRVGGGVLDDSSRQYMEDNPELKGVVVIRV